MEPEKRKKRNRILLLSVLCGVSILLLILYAVFSSSKERAQAAAEGVIRPLRSFLGAVYSIFPFSVMELFYVLLGLGVLAYLVLSVVKIVRNPGKLRRALRRLGALALAGLYAACGLLWLWGLDYQACSFSEREDFRSRGVTVEELAAAAEYFIDSTLALADSVPRDENGCFAADMDGYFASSLHVYDQLEQRFPSLATPSRRPKKMALFSGLMSRMGFTGVYFCFTGESNINVDQTPAFIPFTIAHELAHQKGVASEQECNFLGIAAGITSDIPEYRYSCYLAGTLHLMNSLFKASRETWERLEKKITGPMKTDLDVNNEYWRRYRSPVTAASQKAYDTYLKANGQPLGIESYGACVDLLTEFYLRELQRPVEK